MDNLGENTGRVTKEARGDEQSMRHEEGPVP